MNFMPSPSLSKWPQYHILALVVCVIAARFGLTVGRVIVQDGSPHLPYAEALQFPYPLTATVFQLLLVCAVLPIANFVYSKLPVWRRSQHRFPNTLSNLPLMYMNRSNEDQSSSSSDVDTAQKNTKHSGIAFKTLILGIAIAIDAVLGTSILSFAPLELYIISQGLVLPCAFILSRSILDKGELGVSLVFRSMVLSVGVVLAASCPGLPLSSRLIYASGLLSIFTAFWPLQLQRIRQLLSIPESQYQSLGAEPRDEIQSDDISNRSRSSGLWRILQMACLISVLFLLPILLLSGELGYISRNCYFLGSPRFWINMFLNGLSRFVLILSTTFLIGETNALNVMFFLVLVNVSQVPVLTYSKLLPQQWLGLGICTVAGFSFCLENRALQATPVHQTESYNWFRQVKNSGRRMTTTVISVLAISLITLGYVAQRVYSEESGQTRGSDSPILSTDGHPIPNMLNGTHGYLGPRPQVGAVADLSLLISECRGTYEGMENMRNVFNCLKYLATKQDEYMKVPGGGKRGEIPSYDNAISGQDDRRSETSEYRTRNFMNACGGPVVLYHLWWTGLPTWRTELFIKSYLYTQNLACSKLWIWINSDQDPRALQKWLLDHRFLRFMSFVERGDIVVKKWNLPARVPLSTEVDELDESRYYEHFSRPSKKGENFHVADYVMSNGHQEWLEIYRDATQLTYFTVASSDAARLIILHLHGGVYLDLDMILLRDLRPLILSNAPFAERWGAYTDTELYNNALVSLPANSSISSYILRGGTRMGLVYHFMAIGRMLVAEGRDGKDGKGLLKLETAFFDPIWADVDGLREGRCTVPCLTSFQSVFRAEPVSNEWESFDGDLIPGSIGGNNRTLENFYRGAFAYHVHNQWDARFERGSWIDVICTAQDEFFAGKRTNPYGEMWNGPSITRYGA